MLDRYVKEVFPDNKVYIKDTDENRRIMTQKYGINKLGDLWDYSYIELDTDTNEWRTCLSFEWLYRNQPSLKNINDL